MSVLRVTTWNVLHRVHAENWKEAPVTAFPDEAARIAGITERIDSWLAGDVDVVCLQEVSGDQLAALRGITRSDVHVLAHQYPRLPKMRSEAPCPLADPAEHLVVVVRGGVPTIADQQTFAEDPGKGFLAVTLVQGMVVISTHVSFGDRRAGQLALIARVGSQAPAGAVALGDFNATDAIVRSALGAQTSISDLSGQNPTRRPGGGHPGSVIDHVVAWRGTVRAARVLDCAGLSDHEPVTAIVEIDR